MLLLFIHIFPIDNKTKIMFRPIMVIDFYNFRVHTPLSRPEEQYSGCLLHFVVFFLTLQDNTGVSEKRKNQKINILTLGDIFRTLKTQS